MTRRAPRVGLVLGFLVAAASAESGGLRGGERPGTAAAGGVLTPRGREQWVSHLPGAPLPDGRLFPDYRMVTGYMSVGGASRSRELFYWFVESRGKPRKDPLLLWTNGGPGCSGLAGFLTEMGPFRPTSIGVLAENPHAWTNFANMIFIEQPAGVGFSTIDAQESYEYTDEKTAEDMWAFIKGFTALHPEHKATPFYLVGESYGGHYLPTTALHILNNNRGEVNFQGFTVGNPLTYDTYTTYGMVSKIYAAGLLPKPDFDDFMEKGCYKINTGDEGDIAPANREQCANQLSGWWLDLFPGVTKQADAKFPGFDPYALDFAVCTHKEEMKALHRGLPRPAQVQLARSVAGDSYEPCAQNPINANWATGYLNRADVQRAIHVAGPVDWETCNEMVGSNYSTASHKASMVPVYKKLVANGSLRIMIYSGTDDAVCPLQGLQKWVWDVGYEASEKWRPYVVGGQSAGFTTKFTAPNGAGFRVTTVQGAGHMVPSTKPERAEFIMRRFLAGEW